jgi:hypothetical protein
LDERLEDTFRDWYPDFRTKPESEIKRRLKHPDFYGWNHPRAKKAPSTGKSEPLAG